MNDLFDKYGDWFSPRITDEALLREDFSRVEALIASDPDSAQSVRLTVVRDRIAQWRRMLIPGLNCQPA